MQPVPKSEPLARQRLFQTDELDEARAIVAAKFCDHRLDIASGAEAFDACHHRAEGRAASLNYIRYGADVRIDPGELGSFYLIQIPLAGQADINNSAGEVHTGAGLGSVLNPHRHTRMRWRQGCTQLLLQIDAEALNRQAARLASQALAAPVTFATAVDENRAATANWVRKLKTCFGLAEKGAVFASENINTQVLVEEELITEFLLSQPSDVQDLLHGPRPSAANVHVQRAMQFIRDNLGDPITLGDIADAAGVSDRSLQLGFRAELGQSPMRYLRDQRLAMARRMIRNASPSETVGDICHRAGFAHFGRFSVAYREMFGEPPSATLRR
ncbi:Transcriptional regulator, AraC family [Candidatus Rhodobacter oscarellae]|uniref:Transcriptional regulator, AraC family n=1 Tax=Candidatus Rhodobacter oscarellae TaxID=1675527 RepID=A0A0J9E666_9RHOB|nr:AraC family transcriptional regulator [Candidatus Rhodobacter lobularis]KMW58265.1 Transcriptional regulator, AraC family [Candidatus Rhodobacter lobularis]